MFKKYRVFRIKHTGSRFVKIPVAFTRTLEEAREKLAEGRKSGLHLCVEAI